MNEFNQNFVPDPISETHYMINSEKTAHNDIEDERRQPPKNEAIRLVLEQQLHTEPIGGFDIFLTKDQRLLKEALTEMNELNINLVPDSISKDTPPAIHYGSADSSDSDVNNLSLSTYVFNKLHYENNLESPENPHHIPSNMRETFTDFYRKSMLYDVKSSIPRERSAIMERVCMKGYKLRFRQHIDQGSYPNTSVDEDDMVKDEYKILRYVWKGKLAKLGRHLHKNKNHKYVNVQDACGRTACHFAASWGCERTLQELLRVPDIDVNLQDDEGKTPLFKAIENGSLMCVKLLIQHGADPTIPGYHQSNPFEYLLLEKGDKSIELVEFLYYQGGMKEQRKGDGIMGYLHILGLAKENVSVAKVAKFLINAGEYINATEGSGKTPLMIAVKYNQFHMAHLLISAGADLDHKDFGEKSALDHTNVNENCFEMIEKALIGAVLQPYPQ